MHSLVFQPHHPTHTHAHMYVDLEQMLKAAFSDTWALIVQPAQTEYDLSR